MRIRLVCLLFMVLGIGCFIMGYPAHFGFGMLGAGTGLFLAWPKVADNFIVKLKEQDKEKS